MARFDIGGYTRYNAKRIKPLKDEQGRLVRGSRAPIKPSTFRELGDLSVFGKDLEGWVASLEGLVETSAAVYAAKLAKASEVADYWKSIAPHWGDKDPRGATPPTAYGTNNPDDYAASIKVIRGEGGVVKVGSELNPLATWLEWGSIHNPEHGYGARVLDHFGGGSGDTRELFIR